MNRANDDSFLTLERALRTKSYLVGEQLTLADIIVYLSCATAATEGFISTCPAAARWFDQVQSEIRRKSPSASLPPWVHLVRPVNITGTVPLPTKRTAVASLKETAATSQEPCKDKVAGSRKKKKDTGSKEASSGKSPTAKNPIAKQADIEDPATVFAALDVRVGKIVDVWKHKDADKLWCERIDVGDPEPRTIASGLRNHYANESDLKGRHVLVFANLKARTMQGFKSEGMVLCAANDDHTQVVLLEPPSDAIPGDRVALESVPNVDPATASQVQKKKMLEKVLPHLRTDSDGVACCGDKQFRVASGRVTAPLKKSPIS